MDTQKAELRNFVKGLCKVQAGLREPETPGDSRLQEAVSILCLRE